MCKTGRNLASEYINIVDEKTLQEKVYNRILENSENSSKNTKTPKNSSISKKSKKSKIKKSVSFQDTPETENKLCRSSIRHSKKGSAWSKRSKNNPKTSNFDVKEKSKNSSSSKSSLDMGKKKQTAAFNSPQYAIQGQGVKICDKSKSNYQHNDKPLVDYDSFRSLSITNNLDNFVTDEEKLTEEKKNKKKQK